MLLRTHTSPVQVRVMSEQPPPIYSIMPGRVFRNEATDSTHLAVFHQLECLVVDEGITFGHLAGTIEAFIHAFMGEDFDIRLRPAYFPFTEPSAEFDVQRPDGSWLELGGSGHGPPQRAVQLRHRPRALVGLRLRVRPRPAGPGPLRGVRHPRGHVHRRPLPEPVLMSRRGAALSSCKSRR